LQNSKQFEPDDIDVYSLTKAIELKLDLARFRCEKNEFNDYFHNTALKDHNGNLGRVWIFTTGKRKKRVIGFVTVAMSQLSKQEHKKLSDMTHHKHVPALLLGQMVRDIDFHGRGLGSLMKDWVIARAIDHSKHIGCRLVILHSVDDKIDTYKKWGFVQVDSKKNKNTMFVDLSWHGQ
jgi:hypothetical protein